MLLTYIHCQHQRLRKFRDAGVGIFQNNPVPRKISQMVMDPTMFPLRHKTEGGSLAAIAIPCLIPKIPTEG